MTKHVAGTIKRYRRVRGEPGYSDMMCVRPDGEWVRYDDHLAAILPAQGQDEPVAWQWRFRTVGKRLGEWTSWYDGKAPDLCKLDYGTEERSIYTHPAPAVSLPEDVAGLTAGLSIWIDRAEKVEARADEYYERWNDCGSKLEAANAEVARLTERDKMLTEALKKASGALGDIADGEPEFSDAGELVWCRNRAANAWRITRAALSPADSKEGE